VKIVRVTKTNVLTKVVLALTVSVNL